MLAAGVSVSLNSDDPGLFAITLSGELDVALGPMGLSEVDIQTCTRHALEASFLPTETKNALHARTPEWDF